MGQSIAWQLEPCDWKIAGSNPKTSEAATEALNQRTVPKHCSP